MRACSVLAERFHVDVALARLGEEAFARLLLFLHVMLDHLGKDRDLGVVEFVLGVALGDLGDQHLGAVVLDIGLVLEIVLHGLLAGRIEDFLLDRRVDRELGADLLRQLLLAGVVLGLLELFEQSPRPCDGPP